MKQFEPLLDKNASFDIKRTLNKCFGIETGDNMSSSVHFL